MLAERTQPLPSGRGLFARIQSQIYSSGKISRQSTSVRASASRKGASIERSRFQSNSRLSDRTQAIARAMVDNLKRNIVKDRRP